MVKRQSPNPCAASDCRGGYGRQRAILPGEIEHITGAARIEIGKQAAMKCTYCGAVYTNGQTKRLLGFLGSDILGEGWHPISTK